MSLVWYTIKGKTDGFGSQYLACLSGISYCNFKEYMYIHTPFTKISHNVDTSKANEFIGIHADSMSSDIRCTILEKPYIAEVHYSDTPSIYYTDKVLDYIRNCYYSSEKPLIGEIDIAIHIRRGDVSKERHAIRYTPNRVYIEIIKKLKETYPEYTITVFSEGSYEDFKDLGLEKDCCMLNTDIFTTFHSLVSSKVLLTSNSSFSYCAGILHTNTVYHYDTCPLKKLHHWLNVSDLIGKFN